MNTLYIIKKNSPWYIFYFGCDRALSEGKAITFLTCKKYLNFLIGVHLGVFLIYNLLCNS